MERTACSQVLCSKCEKDRGVARCEGCSKTFCFQHFNQHREQLNREMTEIEYIYDTVLQTALQTQENSTNFDLMEQVRRWEQQSIEQIHQYAERLKNSLAESDKMKIQKSEQKLREMRDILSEMRQKTTFLESDLERLKLKLTFIKSELLKPSDIDLVEEPLGFMKILTIKHRNVYRIPNIDPRTQWDQQGSDLIKVGENNEYAQMLKHPLGLHIGSDDTIYAISHSNQHPVKIKTDSVIIDSTVELIGTCSLFDPKDVVVDKENQFLFICDYGNRRVLRCSLTNPGATETVISDVDCDALALDDENAIYISDSNNHEVRRWKLGDTRGELVAGGNGQGSQLNQLNGPKCLFVDRFQTVYVSDCHNHRVMKWERYADRGVVVAGGSGPGNALNQLQNPCGLAIDRADNLYVADYHNRRIMLWPSSAKQGQPIVQATASNDVFKPFGLRFDNRGNLIISNYGSRTMQRFNIIQPSLFSF